jgi:hypothetical protein
MQHSRRFKDILSRPSHLRPIEQSRWFGLRLGPWILAGKQSGLLTRIATTEKVFASFYDFDRFLDGGFIRAHFVKNSDEDC